MFKYFNTGNYSMQKLIVIEPAVQQKSYKQTEDNYCYGTIGCYSFGWLLCNFYNVMPKSIYFVLH